MRKSAQTGKAIILVIISVVILLVGFIYYSQKTYTQNSKPSPSPTLVASPTPAFKTYTSSFMKFSIQVPSDFQVEEKLGVVSIQNGEGNIEIGMSGTNFNTLREYFTDLQSHNKLTIVNRQDFNSNNVSVIGGDINGNREYIIYANHAVYNVVATSSSLYSELDQIARSFNYNP